MSWFLGRSDKGKITELQQDILEKQQKKEIDDGMSSIKRLKELVSD